MNKKGFVVAPVIFIVMLMIAITFSLYVSSIDREIAKGVRTSASIQMGVYEIEKELIRQETFVRLAIHECNCDKICVEDELNDTLGDWDWNVKIDENSFQFNSLPINATNINMNLNSSKIEGNFSGC